MSLLRLLGNERRAGDPVADALGMRRMMSRSGAADPSQAMRLSSVWAAVNLISDLISTLPVGQYRGTGATRVEVPRSTIVANPGNVPPISWRRQVLVSWLLRGNAFILPTSYEANQYPRTANVISPDRVRCRIVDGSPEWMIDGKPVPELLHFPAYTMPGSIIGLSPLEHAAKTIGLGLAAEDFGLQWFTDGAHPSAALLNDRETDATGAKRVKDRFIQATRGNREPIVLGGGWKYEAIQVSPADAQFLETVQANTATVAQFFGLRSEDIGGASLDSQTYANVEQRSLDRLTFPIAPWVIRFEEMVNSMLPRPQFVKLNMDALVRVDLRSRYEAHGAAIRNGMASPDERRALEDQPPIRDGKGDVYLWPPMSTTPVPPEVPSGP